MKNKKSLEVIVKEAEVETLQQFYMRFSITEYFVGNKIFAFDLETIDTQEEIESNGETRYFVRDLTLGYGYNVDFEELESLSEELRINSMHIDM